MKMVKKVLFGLVAAAAVVGFAGCKFGAGEGSTSGSKYNLDMTVDGTELSEGYRRYWKQLSSSKKVAETKVTITIDTEDCEITSGTTATVGYAFDLNKNETINDTVDFILVGMSIEKGFYVERYVGVEEGKTAEGDTTDSSLGGTTTSLDGKNSGAAYKSWSDANITLSPAGTVYTFIVEISQTDQKYTVKINGTTVASDITPSNNSTKTIDGTEYAIGGVACYGSVSAGNKIVANYLTDKDDVTGSYYEEVEE